MKSSSYIKWTIVMLLIVLMVTLPLTIANSSNNRIFPAVADGDTDDDEVPDASDNCPFTANAGRIVFGSTRDGNSEIYVMDADGTNQINLSNHPQNDGEPSYSPDLSKIAFETTRDGNFEIYVMNADGTNQINLTNNAVQDSVSDVFSRWQQDCFCIRHRQQQRSLCDERRWHESD